TRRSTTILPASVRTTRTRSAGWYRWECATAGNSACPSSPDMDVGRRGFRPHRLCRRCKGGGRMSFTISKRAFLSGTAAAALLGMTAGSARIAVAAAPARQRVPKASLRARTTPLFRCPEGFPNALSGSPEGLWVGEQKLSGELARRYGVPEPADLGECAWLLDWKTGEVKRTVRTESRNTSGMGVGGG